MRLGNHFKQDALLAPLFLDLLVVRLEPHVLKRLAVRFPAVRFGVIVGYGLAAALAVKLFDEFDAHLAVSSGEDVGKLFANLKFFIVAI